MLSYHVYHKSAKQGMTGKSLGRKRMNFRWTSWTGLNLLEHSELRNMDMFLTQYNWSYIGDYEENPQHRQGLLGKWSITQRIMRHKSVEKPYNEILNDGLKATRCVSMRNSVTFIRLEIRVTHLACMIKLKDERLWTRSRVPELSLMDPLPIISFFTQINNKFQGSEMDFWNLLRDCKT